MWSQPRGGGTPPGFGYPLQKGPRELWLSTRSRLEKGGVVTDPSTLRRGAVRGGLLCGGSSFWLVYSKESIMD